MSNLFIFATVKFKKKKKDKEAKLTGNAFKQI